MGKKEEALAENQATSPEILDALAKNYGHGVQKRVAANPKSSPDTLLFLAKNVRHIEVIAALLFLNPNTPDSVLSHYSCLTDLQDEFRYLAIRRLSTNLLQGVIVSLKKDAESSREDTPINRLYTATEWGLIGKALERLGDYTGAMEACQQSLRVNKKFAMPYFVMALVHVAQGDIESGLEQLFLSFKYSELYSGFASTESNFDKIKERPDFKKKVRRLYTSLV